MIDAYRDSYPHRLTPQEIAKKVGKGKDENVSTYVGKLSDMFVKRNDKESFVKVRGKPPVGQSDHTKRPAWTYSFEDKNFASNQKDNFQFAPGSVRYSPRFLESYKKIVNLADQDDIFPLLVKFLENVFKEVKYSSEDVVRQIAPQTDKNFICSNCGFNHEARDFIRALLLHLIDQMEMSHEFANFLKGKDFLSHDAYLGLQNIVKSNGQEVNWKAKKRLDTLRILSVNKGSGTLFGRLLGIAKNGAIRYGIFDNSLLGIIHAGAIVECYPSISDGDGYIALYGTDYVATVDNDPSFPSRLHHRYIADIQKSIRTEHMDDPFTLYTIRAEMVGGIAITERSVHSNPVQAFKATIDDGTGEIELFGQCDDKICEELHDGDKIKIIGAFINTTTSDDGDGGWAVTDVELRLSPYGSIVITEPSRYHDM